MGESYKNPYYLKEKEGKPDIKVMILWNKEIKKVSVN